MFVSEFSRASEETPAVVPPVSSAVLESQPPPQRLAPNHLHRTEESERPVERQPPRELPPEPCKAPMRVPMSGSILESLPLTHVSTTLPGETTFFSFNIKVTCFTKPNLFFSSLHSEVSVPSSSVHLPQQKPVEVPVAMSNPSPFTSSIMAPIGRPTTVPHDTDEDEGLKHFEQVSFKGFCYTNTRVPLSSLSVRVNWAYSRTRRQKRW